MLTSARALIRIGSMTCLLVACATAAIAQETVRVTRDQATIWTSDFVTIAAVVPAGTLLSVFGRRGDWYAVAVPDNATVQRRSGFIFKSNVEPVTAPANSPAPQRQTPAAASLGPRVSLLGFGQFGYTRFAARQSFSAVLGQPGGTVFGGGVEMRLRGGWFLNGSVERFSHTGQRAVVVDGDVFRLGTPDTISLMPLALTSGWRFVNERAIPYVGAGIGKVFYKETSSFVDPSDNIDRQFTSYHVLGGVEFRNEWVGTAFEVEYSRVPDALGAGGVSAAFHESNLGGIVGRIRIIIGR